MWDLGGMGRWGCGGGEKGLGRRSGIFGPVDTGSTDDGVFRYELVLGTYSLTSFTQNLALAVSQNKLLRSRDLYFDTFHLQHPSKLFKRDFVEL